MKYKTHREAYTTGFALGWFAGMLSAIAIILISYFTR